MNILNGIPAAPGVRLSLAAVAQVTRQNMAATTLDEAVQRCLADLDVLYQKTLAELDEKSAEIFASYKSILTDQYLLKAIQGKQEAGHTLSKGISLALEEFARPFDRAKTPYMRQRAEDIRAIRDLLLRQTSGKGLEFVLPHDDSPFVVFAETLSPADTMNLDIRRLAGFVTHLGGTTSHVVILAKTLGIPAVVGFDHLGAVQAGSPVIVDGTNGRVILEPDTAMVKEAQTMQEIYQHQLDAAAQIPPGPVATADGIPVAVSVNIGTSNDLEGLDLTSLHGVGLYRTEFVFSERQTLPTVEEQCAEYRQVFDHLDGRELVVRTLDIGGDKHIPYIQTPPEENPFLGCRGIRLCLQQQHLLRSQFTALLLAANGRPFSVMFPMVDTVEEFLEAKSTWNNIADELLQSGQPVSKEIALGIMIETPAAVFCAESLARHVDFASIGTNDLVQYMMAADRGNAALTTLVTHYQPAVVRAIAHAVSAFCKHGKKISVCGESGSDTDFLPMLIGMGLRYVSVGKASVPLVRSCIVHTIAQEQQQKLEFALSAETVAQLQRLLNAPSRSTPAGR